MHDLMITNSPPRPLSFQKRGRKEVIMGESIRETARNLRKEQSSGEKVFWEIVRNRKLGVKFLRQFTIPFLYEGKKRFFIADFYCFEKKLVVEIDGGIHEKKVGYDRLRDYIINQLGMKVIRFKNEEMQDAKSVVFKLMKYLQGN
ncbi:MAG: endonuclease domain-containing protein [Clostridia bacterium]|nr:endonuclease domain-containing protein [Clostridia bacterium]